MMEQPEELMMVREGIKYVGYLKLEVDAEAVDRDVIQNTKDYGGDLLNIETHRVVIRKVGRTIYWYNKSNLPCVTVTPIAAPQATTIPAISAPTPVMVQLAPKGKAAPKPKPKGKTKEKEREERLKEKCKSVAPHLWEQECRLPILDLSEPKVVREQRSKERNYEKTTLARIREQLRTGKFVIDEQAALEEELWKERQQEQDAANIRRKMEAGAMIVNGSRHN